MSLRHTLLALLETRPMTGYELVKQFDRSAIHVWHAQHPQIYTELRRLTTEGLLQANTAPRGAGATKRTYVLTEAGCAELTRWINEVDVPQRERDPAYAKAIYFEFGSFAAARRQFRALLDHYTVLEQQWRAHADQLERRDTMLIQQRLAKAPEQAHNAIVAYKVHVYRGLADRARSQMAWAQEGLELVDRLENDANVASSDVTIYPPEPGS